MTDKTHPYDPNLPYVVEKNGSVARFSDPRQAEIYCEAWAMPPEVIDTTPKPRVPEDAKFVTWKLASGVTHVSRAVRGSVQHGNEWVKPEDLPGVTAKTTFTVLEERKS